MAQFLEKLVDNIKTGIAFSSKKIEEYSHIGKLKIDISLTKRSIDRSYLEMGKKTYMLLEAGNSNGIASDEEVQSAIRRIKNSEQILKELEEKLSEAVSNQNKKQ